MLQTFVLRIRALHPRRRAVLNIPMKPESGYSIS
jgi:hypothetical protein